MVLANNGSDTSEQRTGELGYCCLKPSLQKRLGSNNESWGKTPRLISNISQGGLQCEPIRQSSLDYGDVSAFGLKGNRSIGDEEYRMGKSYLT